MRILYHGSSGPHQISWLDRIFLYQRSKALIYELLIITTMTRSLGSRILQSDRLHRPWKGMWWPLVLSQHSTHVLLQWTKANPRRAPGNKLLSSQRYRAELMDLRMWYQGALPVVREGARASSSSKDFWKQVTADLRQLLSFCSIGWQRFVRAFW